VPEQCDNYGIEMTSRNTPDESSDGIRDREEEPLAVGRPRRRAAEPRGLDDAELESLTATVADKALEEIRKRLKWPLLIAGAFAAYSGYNVWSDVTDRISRFQAEAERKLTEFQAAANTKLAEIDETADKRLAEQFQKVLEARKADISELTSQLRRDSAEAVIAAERARITSRESTEAIQRQASDTLANVKSQANRTLAAIQKEADTVVARREVFIQQLELSHQALAAAQKAELTSRASRGAGGLQSQQALLLIRVPEAIAEAGSVTAVRVAIIGTGITPYAIPDTGDELKGRIVGGRSFVGGEAIRDEQGHGTQVASLVAAIAPSAQFISVKVFGPNGTGDQASLLAGFDYAVSANAQIVVVPLSTPERECRPYSVAFELLRSAGAVTIVSAGNESGEVRVPGRCAPAFAVAGTDLKDRRISFSNVGPQVRLAAPAANVITVSPSGSYGTNNGTSFSAAIVAGVAALVRGIRPDLGPAEVEDVLEKSARAVDPSSEIPGAGRVDALAAVRLAKTYKK
jgi:hypothetical protein